MSFSGGGHARPGHHEGYVVYFFKGADVLAVQPVRAEKFAVIRCHHHGIWILALLGKMFRRGYDHVNGQHEFLANRQTNGVAGALASRPGI